MGAPSTAPGRGAEVLLVTAVTTLAAAIRLAGLGDRPLWIDEAYTAWLVRRPWPEFIGVITWADQHPPLFYLLLRLVAPDGAGDVAVRVPSVVAAVATVPVVYLLARSALPTDPAGAGAEAPTLPMVVRSGAPRTLAPRALPAGIAALLLAVSPLHVAASQQARMYALLTLLVALALLGAVLGCTLPGARRGPVVLAVGLGGALLTHHLALLLVPVILLVAVTCPEARRPVGIGLLAAVASWAPWAPVFVRQALAVDAGFWIPAPTAATVADHARDLLSARPPWPVDGAVITVGLLLAAIGTARARRRPPIGLLLAAGVLVPSALALLAGLRRPVFSTHALVWTVVPFLVLVALGIGALRRPGHGPVAPAAVTALVLMVNAASLGAHYAAPGPEDWPAAAQRVATEAADSDLVLFHAGWTRLAFDRYYPADGPAIERRGLPVDLFERGTIEPPMTEADLPALRAGLIGRSRVWLVYSHEWYTDPGRLVHRELTAWFGDGRPFPVRSVVVWRFGA